MGHRHQQQLFPSVIDDFVAANDPVRVYDAFVDALDLASLGFKMNPEPGADSYFPKDLLKLIIYGYSYGVRTSRKLERACHHNLSFQWLMGGQKPDFRTIGRFRSNNKKSIKKVLKKCVRICIRLDLIEGNTIFTDGSKFRANAAISKTWSKKRCEEKLKKIDKEIDCLIDSSERMDLKEDGQESLIKIKEEIADKKKFVAKIKDTLEQIKQTDKNYVNTTDPESMKAKGRQGTHACHNIQITTDKKHGLIVHGESVSQNHDNNLLKDQLNKASEVLGKKPENVCADSGYSSVDDLCQIDPEIQVVVPSKKQVAEERGKESKLFDKDKFEYDEVNDEYICPSGNRLKPDFHNREEQHIVYRAQLSDCQNCQHYNICTKAKNGRTITRSIHEDVKTKLENIYKSPEGQEIYQFRKQKAELPFGHMKYNLGAGQFLLRGREKVDAEVSILSTCFNLARMITIIGVSELITLLGQGNI